MLTLLTATGCRPVAWAICERLMARQTYAGEVRWLVVDDGPEPQPVTFSRPLWTVEVIRPDIKWEPGLNTQASNLLEGLDRVAKDARLLIIEDDDCYAPEYLDRVNGWLDSAQLVGECCARYYQMGTGKHRQLSNRGHASLCSTALRGKLALDSFRQECRRSDKFIDLGLWRKFVGTKALYESRLVVGLKGLPGRGGIGMGHRGDFAGHPDPSGSVFRQWVGANVDLYEGLA